MIATDIMKPLISAALVVCLLGGCGTVLLERPRGGDADGWTITLLKLIDGPDQWGYGGHVNWRPGSGYRFLHAIVSFRNDAPQARELNYRACSLDHGSHDYLPRIIDQNLVVVNAVLPMEATYAPGEECSRRLIFAYPEKGFPTRLKCGTITIDLPRWE